MKECPTCRGCFPDDVIHCPEDGTATTISIAGEPILDGRYQLEKRLGQGGMGVVYKARHIFLKTAHAIKIILPDLVGNDPNLVTRFRQEALAAAAIRHQNIIAVTDFGVVRGTMPFLVMEFVQGKSLQDIMAEEHAMSPVRAFELMQPICAGIAAAHRQGIVHRDLKPLNVMVCEGLPTSEGVKILDFGLAKIKSGELLGSFIAAQTTGLMGSPFYMAPEQWSDEPPDARADVYSLGVMLFQMLAGEVPFRGSSIPAIMKKHLTEHVPSFISKGVSVPPEIEVVVRHALEKEPQDRTESADEFAKELRAAMSHASAMMSRTGDPPTVDPSRTLVTPPPAQTSVPPSSYSSYSSMSSGSTSLHDPMAGTISSASLAEEEQKNLFAQQELAREQEVRRKLDREAAAKRKAEEDAKRAEEVRLAEAARLKAEQEKRAEEARLQTEAQKRAEEEARAAEQRRLEEERRVAEQAAREAEARRLFAEQEERQRVEAERLKREQETRVEAQRRAEQEKLAEQQRLAEEKRKAEEARQAEEQRKAEEQRRLQEAAAREAERKRAEELAAAQKAAAQKAAEQKQKDTAVNAAPFATTPLVQTPAQHPLGASTIGETSLAGMPKPYPAARAAIAAKKKSSSLPIAIAAVLILVVAGGGVGGYMFWKSRRTTTPPPPPEKPTDPLDVPVKANLIDIPGGPFKMGRDDGEKTEGPAHQVNVIGFSMDKTEVTNLEYAQFVKQTSHTPPPQWGGARPAAGEEQLPVSNVTYEDAVAFAEWRSQRDGVKYRLPTEEEWEFAARNGDQSNLYPWGNTWEADRAITQESGAVNARKVGSNARGADRWGVQDLMGNVYEWTSTRASLYPGNPLKLPDVQKDWLVIRGGGYGTPAAKVNGTYRDWFSPTYKNPLLGFRLVKVAS
jgi:serine/threonine protein kinase/formylglycine-generating enzyme required for sulfatase activity